MLQLFTRETSKQFTTDFSASIGWDNSTLGAVDANSTCLMSWLKCVSMSRSPDGARNYVTTSAIFIIDMSICASLRFVAYHKMSAIFRITWRQLSDVYFNTVTYLCRHGHTMPFAY